MTKLKCFSYTVGIFRFRVFSILIGVIFRNLVDYPSSWSTYVNVRCKLNKYNKNRYVGSCVLRFYHTSSQRHNWPWTKRYTNSTHSHLYLAQYFFRFHMVWSISGFFWAFWQKLDLSKTPKLNLKTLKLNLKMLKLDLKTKNFLYFAHVMSVAK